MKHAKLAIAGCLAAGIVLPAAAQDNFSYIGTSLFGEYETSGGAGPDQTADFSAELDLGKGRICYMLEVDGIDDFTAAHIHEGRKGKDGPPVMKLELMGDDGRDVCVDADKELLAKIARKPGEYYVNVHTVRYPDGAVRGQLDE